jgi:hypothetical protein
MSRRNILFLAVLMLPSILALRYFTANIEEMRAKEKARIERITQQPDYRAEFLRRAAL